MNTTEIAQQLLAPAKHLQQAGLSYHTYLTDLTWLLFLKVAPAIGQSTFLPPKFDWDNFIQQSSYQQYESYQTVITALSQVDEPHIAGIFTQARTSFETPAQLTQVIAALVAIDEIPITELGEMYETVLELGESADDNRLHLAPRSLVDIMVILTQPQWDELIQDPLAGTGSLLVAAYEYIKVIHEEEMQVHRQPSLLRAKSLQPPKMIAVEPDLVRQRLALMNCLLHGLILPLQVPVWWGDSLLSDRKNWPLADVILSLLVFASEPSEELSKHDASLALLQQICQTLKPGGRAAVVLSDRVLKAPGPAQPVRTYLLDTCVLHTVVRLPYGIFYPNKVSACLLFFRRSQSEDEKTSQVWFYDLRNHCPIFGPYLTLTRDYLKPLQEFYGDDPLAPRHQAINYEPKRWQVATREDLKNQMDRLDTLVILPEEEEWEAEVDWEEEVENIWTLLDDTRYELEDLVEILR
jgi:type I restriction enzyme M protein